MNVPNAISLFRLLLVPVIFVVVYFHYNMSALLVLGIAALSDWLDGYLARRLDQMTVTGQLLDPLVDKLFMLSVIVAMWMANLMPLSAMALLIFRDVCMILIGLNYYVHGKRNAPANWMGKVTTTLYYAAVTSLLLQDVIPYTQFFLWGVIAFSGGTAVLYWFQAERLNRE